MNAPEIVLLVVALVLTGLATTVLNYISNLRADVKEAVRKSDTTYRMLNSLSEEMEALYSYLGVYITREREIPEHFVVKKSPGKKK